jgi:hypothetical protein
VRRSYHQWIALVPVPVVRNGTLRLSGLRLGSAGVVRYLSRMTTVRDPIYEVVPVDWTVWRLG